MISFYIQIKKYSKALKLISNEPFDERSRNRTINIQRG